MKNETKLCIAGAFKGCMLAGRQLTRANLKRVLNCK